MSTMATKMLLRNGAVEMGPQSKIGTCTDTQDFVIDFTGPEPAIRDYKVGQAIE